MATKGQVKMCECVSSILTGGLIGLVVVVAIVAIVYIWEEVWR